MKNFFTICFLLFKNYSLLRIYQIIESKKQILNGLSLEFGASENITKNFSNFIQGSSKFEYSNLANFGNKEIIPLNLKKKLMNNILIAYKVNNEIITNIDIEDEATYLIALNNNLTKLDNIKIRQIAAESILREKIKKTELIKYFELNQKNPYLVFKYFNNNFKSQGHVQYTDFLNSITFKTSLKNLNLNNNIKLFTVKNGEKNIIFEKFINKKIVN